MPSNKSKTGMKMVGVDTTLVRPKVSPPSEMTKSGKKIWRKLVNSVPNEQFTVSDFVVLAAYCENYATMIKARIMLDAEGEILVDDSGKLYKNPWFTVMQESTGKVTALATKLRLCPSARQKAEVTKEKATPSRATSKLGSLIHG